MSSHNCENFLKTFSTLMYVLKRFSNLFVKIVDLSHFYLKFSLCDRVVTEN